MGHGSQQQQHANRTTVPGSVLLTGITPCCTRRATYTLMRTHHYPAHHATPQAKRMGVDLTGYAHTVSESGNVRPTSYTKHITAAHTTESALSGTRVYEVCDLAAIDAGVTSSSGCRLSTGTTQGTLSSPPPNTNRRLLLASAGVFSNAGVSSSCVKSVER